MVRALHAKSWVTSIPVTKRPLPTKSIIMAKHNWKDFFKYKGILTDGNAKNPQPTERRGLA